jgi:hypothetical protein
MKLKIFVEMGLASLFGDIDEIDNICGDGADDVDVGDCGEDQGTKSTRGQGSRRAHR